VRVLVATKQTQGQRKNDFCHATVNEIVMFGTECTHERIDGKCGCKRSLTGVLSGKATTTFRVTETDLTPDDLCATRLAGLRATGWGKYLSDEELTSRAREDVAYLTSIVGDFKPGDVLERRGNTYRLRRSRLLVMASNRPGVLTA